MIRVFSAAAAIVLALMAADSFGQAPKPASAPKRPVTPPRTTSVLVSVRDHDGASLSGVHLFVSGAEPAELETAGAGTAIIPNLKDGVYRVRCERAGFITLERDFIVRGGTRNSVDIVLDAAPPPPAPPPPPPPVVAGVAASGPPVAMSILDFIDRNFIGREPIKESILACEPLETVRLLQIRDGIAKHTHDRVDEIIYVVAGDGSVRIDEDARPLRPGSLVVVPHGTTHSFEHAGKNPLVVVSTLSGSACEASKTAAKP
jgi:hypothetical protein